MFCFYVLESANIQLFLQLQQIMSVNKTKYMIICKWHEYKIASLRGFFVEKAANHIITKLCQLNGRARVL